jgi:hypothetical protein
MASLVPIRGSNVLGCTLVAFSFVANGTGAVDQTTIRGPGVVSVTRGATGRFDVVLDSAFYRVISAKAHVIHPSDGSAPTAAPSAIVSFADETASPLALKVWTLNASGAAADQTATRVCVVMVVQASAGA